MSALIDQFGVIAQTFSPAEIQQKIIFAASTEINNILNQFFRQVNSFVDRVDILIDEVDCKAEGIATAIKNDLIKISRSFGPFNLIRQAPCRNELHISLLKSETELTNSEFYLLTRCSIENQISKNIDNIKVEQILGYYADMQGIAKRMRCVERGSAGSSDFFTREYIKYGEYYDAWKNT